MAGVEVRARLVGIRMSPQKVRLVLDVVRGPIPGDDGELYGVRMMTPEPSFDPFGHPRGPFVWRLVTLHFGKYRAFTTAPFGNRSSVCLSCSGAGAAGSEMLMIVRSEIPPRVLWRSCFE